MEKSEGSLSISYNNQKRFEIRRNAELMKTQRLDAKYKRLEEEKERRRLQRRLYYENRTSAHKKLISRVKAKTMIQRAQRMVLSGLKDIGYIQQDPIEDIKMQFMPWLYEQTTSAIIHREDMESSANNLIGVAIDHFLNEHNLYLTMERERLQKIKDDEEKAEAKFLEDRRKRRQWRAQMRLAREKRRFREALDERVITKRKAESDPLKIMCVDFEDELPFENACRTYGGFIFEILSVLSTAKNFILEKEAEKYPTEESFKDAKEVKEPSAPHSTPEDNFMLGDDLRQFLFNFMNSHRIHERSIRLNFKESVKQPMIEGFEMMKENLFKFDEMRQDLINSLLEQGCLFESSILQRAWNEELLDRDIFNHFQRIVLEILFKSTKYVIPQKPKLEQEEKPAEQGEQNEANKDEAAKDGEAAQPTEGEGTAAQEPAPEANAEVQEEVVEAEPEPEYVIPEIKPEDKVIESLKNKFDIVFVVEQTEEEAAPNGDVAEDANEDGEGKEDNGQEEKRRPSKSAKEDNSNTNLTSHRSNADLTSSVPDYTIRPKQVRDPENPSFEAIARLREDINREPENLGQTHRSSMLKTMGSGQDSMLDEPKGQNENDKLREFQRKYLLDEYEAKLKKEEEERRMKIEEEKRKEKEAYIEQYYGDRYDNDLLEFEIKERERPCSTIPQEYAEDVIFINEVNRNNLRDEIERKLKEVAKDSFKPLMKSTTNLAQGGNEINLKDGYIEVDKLMEEMVLAELIGKDGKFKDEMPVFDFEV